MELPWTDLKVCFPIPCDDPDPVWECKRPLPKGWELIETGISGCAGYVAIFRVEVIPTINDGLKVEKWLARIKSKEHCNKPKGLSYR